MISERECPACVFEKCMKHDDRSQKIGFLALQYLGRIRKLAKRRNDYNKEQLQDILREIEEICNTNE